MIYKHNFLEGNLATFDKIIEKKIENVEYIDMEAYGFFQTASIFFKKDKIIVLNHYSQFSKDDKEVIEEDDLIVPHPYMEYREFVLKPLEEIIPNFVHPLLLKRISTLKKELENEKN